MLWLILMLLLSGNCFSVGAAGIVILQFGSQAFWAAQSSEPRVHFTPVHSCSTPNAKFDFFILIRGHIYNEDDKDSLLERSTKEHWPLIVGCKLIGCILTMNVTLKPGQICKFNLSLR